MRWNSLVEKRSVRYETISEILLEVDSYLQANIGNIRRPGLLSGKAGVALFFAYFGKHLKDSSRIRLGKNLLMESIDDVDAYTGPTSGNGLAGILFTYQHFLNEKFCGGPTRFLVKMDEQLAFTASQFSDDKNYDLFHGGLGIANYFLERNYQKDTSSIVRTFASKLIQASHKTTEGTAWLHFPELFGRREKPVFNFGFVHGIPSIIAFIAILIRKKIINETATLQSAIEFMLNNQNKSENISRFPNFISQTFENETPDRVSRLGYCYGDSGISFALAQASRILKPSKIRDTMKKISLQSAGRREDDAGLKDACFCHGTAGNIHIYNRLWNSTPHPALRKAALYWLDVLLTKKSAESGLSAFDFCGYDKATDSYNRRPVMGLLEGYSGVGLALLATISRTEPKWDRPLLLTH